MKLKLRHYVGPVFGLVLFIIAMWALRATLHKHHYHDIIESLSGLSYTQVLLALMLTAGNYLVLTFYDTLAFRTIKLPLAYHRIALGSFLGYVFSHNIGLSVLGSGAARYRVYSSWGISAADTVKVVVFCGVTFWIGFFVLEGLSLQFSVAVPPTLPIGSSLLKYIGTFFLALMVGYLLLALLRRRPIVVGNRHFAVPGPGTALLQIALSGLDWMLAGSVLFVLLPLGSGMDFVNFMGVFLLAECAALCSHVPGGLGVLEIVVPNLMPQVPVPAVLGSLLIYRAVYYLLPLALGVLALAGHEVVQGRRLFRLIRLPELLGDWVGALVPRVLSVTIFIGGALLVLSAAVPSSSARMHWLAQYLPPPAVDISHFVAALAGAALMLLARSLQRRINAAYYLVSGLLIVGIGACLARSWHYEEAIILAMILAVLLPCRREFYRTASVVADRFSPAWIASVTAVIFSAVWLAMFSHKSLLASIATWNDFLSHSSTRRFIHTSMGIATVVILYAAFRLLRSPLPKPAAPTRENMDKARRIIAAADDTSACLALAGDKSMMFSPSGDSFLMYAVQKRSWIAMGDPAGKDDECIELIWRFGDLADKYDGWCVFYQASQEKLPLYLDMGLTSLKLGEEAHVELADFSLEGPAKRALRHVHNKVANEGCVFEVVPAEAAPSLLGQFRQISDEWLAGKGASEKGFSRGFFSVQYLSNFPAAVVKRDGRVLAFANLLSGAGKKELSVDLMRYRPGLIRGLKDYLLIETMLWGRREGYQWFNLGMTPLPGLPVGRGELTVPGVAEEAETVWNTLGGLMFRHGEHFNNFHSLRRYKEKFFPIWHPKYLVTPGGLALPRILANLAELLTKQPIDLVNNE